MIRDCTAQIFRYRFLESIYKKALPTVWRQKDLQANNQVPLIVEFRGEVVGEFFIDILVESKVLLELKTANSSTNEHYAQTINYLKATDIEVGLLINFGNPNLNIAASIIAFSKVKY